MVRLYLDTGEQKYHLDVSIDASVNRLEETIRMLYSVPAYMQCIYFNDKNLKSENASLGELGIADKSNLDFCVDGEVTELSCRINDKVVKFHHSERCQITLFCQDVSFALSKNGIRYENNKTILLTYSGIHLRDSYQICYYPLFRHSQLASVEVEVVNYIGVKDDVLQYACCNPEKKWIQLQYGDDISDVITVDAALSGNSLEEYIVNAISSLYEVSKHCILLCEQSSDTFQVLLSLKVDESAAEFPFAVSLHHFFQGSFLAPSHFPKEPFSYSLQDATPLFQLLRNEDSCCTVQSQSILLINLISRTHTQSLIALDSPLYSLTNILFGEDVYDYTEDVNIAEIQHISSIEECCKKDHQTAVQPIFILSNQFRIGDLTESVDSSCSTYYYILSLLAIPSSFELVSIEIEMPQQTYLVTHSSSNSLCSPFALWDLLSLKMTYMMHSPNALVEFFAVMNSNSSMDVDDINTCQKFIKRIVISDSFESFEGIIKEDLLKSQDYLFSFNEIHIPYDIFMSNPQNIGILFHMQNYIDDIDVEFQVNDEKLKDHRELIEFSARMNLHIHTYLNGESLLPAEEKTEIHFNDKTIDSEVLLSLYQQLATRLSGGMDEGQKSGLNLEYLRDISHSINSQLNTAMMVKDENVEPDLESFRWIHRGKSGIDVFLKKLEEACGDVKHVILEGNQLTETQRLNCTHIITSDHLPQLSSLTLCYDNYSLFLCHLLQSKEIHLLYLRVTDAIVTKEDIEALATFLSHSDCPMRTLVMENIPVTRFISADRFIHAISLSGCFTRCSRN